MNQLQIHKLVFCLNNRLYRARSDRESYCTFLGRDVITTGIPNSKKDIYINREMLMENRKKIHQKRVLRKGKSFKGDLQLGQESSSSGCSDKGVGGNSHRYWDEICS